MRATTTSAIARLCGGPLLGAALAVPLLGGVAGIAPPATAATLTARDASGGLQACVASTYAAIERHRVITATPPACRGLSRAQVSLAASTAIRLTETGGSKAARRQQAGAAAQWARAMISDPTPAAGGQRASPVTVHRSAGAAAGGLGLDGVSELAARVGA
ncbi:MAG: hypothetical protein ACRDOI_01615, partial [Trebonia sp.]